MLVEVCYFYNRWIISQIVVISYSLWTKWWQGAKNAKSYHICRIRQKKAFSWIWKYGTLSMQILTILSDRLEDQCLAQEYQYCHTIWLIGFCLYEWGKSFTKILMHQSVIDANLISFNNTGEIRARQADQINQRLWMLGISIRSVSIPPGLRFTNLYYHSFLCFSMVNCQSKTMIEEFR